MPSRTIRWRKPTMRGFLVLGLLLALPCAGWTQQQSAAMPSGEAPVDAESGFLQIQGAQPRFEAASKISPQALVAVEQQRITSVPHFSGSFDFAGRNFPFTIVGAKPQSGGSTAVRTQLIAVTLFFDGFVDSAGEPIVLSPVAILPQVLGSPNFRNAIYQTGITQFADAVQRAQFYRVMAPDWHTLLGTPELLKAVVIQVPRDRARVYRNRSTGAVYALVDTAFFISHLNTIVQLEDLQPDALAVLLTANVFLAPDLDVKRCCVLGFHTAFDAGQVENTHLIQTMVWASWLDQGILSGNVGDVTPLSHEISEWMNNPFDSNLVPAWTSPGVSGSCQNNLETADPVATLPNAGYPVTIDGFTFHPQTQVLLPWFTRGPSDTFDGALSFPDQGLVTRVSQPCGR
jgi:chitinase